MKVITSKLYIPVTSALVAGSFALGKVWAVSSWVTTVDLRLSRIEERLGIQAPPVVRDKSPDAGFLNTASADEKQFWPIPVKNRGEKL